MRVAMVIQSFRPVLGGAQRQVEQLGPLLAARGVDVHVVTRRPAGTPAREDAPGLTIHRTPGTAAGRGAGAAYVAGAAARTVALRPDVIHAHDLLSPTSAALAAGRVLGAPVVTKILSAGAGGDVDRLLTKPLGARRLRGAARRVAAFVTLADAVEDELVAHGVPRSRFARIANGVDLTRFAPADPAVRGAERARLGVGGDAPLAVYCGRFADVKRVPALVRACGEAGLALVVAGEGAEEGAVRAAAAPYGDRVVVRATVTDVAPLLRAADLYVSASTTEGMSGSVLEAMACGLPVVASPASGMADMLGADGVAADASEAALAAALARAAGDPGWRAAVGARHRATAQARFSLEATADRLVALYERVRAGAPARP